jgi:RNA polymerase sigma-70 factor (ECF subfamily)
MAKSPRRPIGADTECKDAVAEIGAKVRCCAVTRHLLEAIYRQERDGLIRYLKRQVGRDLAPDIAQEVFLRAATSPLVPRLVNPGGFLHCIAHNILIDRARRRRCRIEPLPLIEARDAPFAAEQEHELEASDLKQTLEHALTALPEKTRRVFVMHRFEDMAYRDIHRELGISVATVEYHMMKALAHIRVAVDAAR